jgi:uncharacterized protein (TIGR03437 family)
MCHKATGRLLLAAGCWLAFGAAAWAQGGGPRPEWRRLGAYTVELALASPASGPVERVWFSPDGGTLFARTGSGRVFETADFERWQPAGATPAPAEGDGVPRASAADPLRRYRFGDQVHRSDDGGLTWVEQTAHDGESILGAPVRDLAVSPRDADEVVVSNDLGVWRTLDGGVSWSGLNEWLPNLPIRRLLALPEGSHGLRALADGLGALEWAPGEKQAWRPVADGGGDEEAAARRGLSALLGAPVEGLFVDPGNPRWALAALGRPSGSRVLRTVNGGLSWEDFTADLPEGAVRGVTADPAAGAIYLATDRGVFFSGADLNAAPRWSRVAGALPGMRALDVKLDAEGNQLFVALEGYGVYAGLAPHRLGSLRVVNAADLSPRPAAPGSLLSVLGGRVRTARAGELNFPVLAASETESQIQVPFEVRDRLISLALEGGARGAVVGLQLRDVSPAIFVDRDGTPLVINAASGVLSDAMNPAYSGSRVQILATGLGQVRPEWPSGLAAPAENPPRVVAEVRAFLDGEPLEVTRAVLAPGYVGLYLVEVQLPSVLNRGPAELLLQAEGQDSNRVRIYLEP